MKTPNKVYFLLLISSLIYGQVQQYRNDEYGNIQYRRENTVTGNRIRTLAYNNGEIGQWPFAPSGEWPKGTGQGYLNGFTSFVAAEVTAPGNNAVIHPLQISYREWMDKDPVTGQVWGFEPLPGYSNSNSTNFANSTNLNSWPESWPEALGVGDGWNREWYGYFGRGVLNADYEAFYVMDDSKDQEFTREPYNYYPVASDHNRGGLGLRVEVRTLNWNTADLKDVSFWHYDIINISDNNYEKTISGFYVDPGVGGTNDSQDDIANYDSENDFVYQYDYNGFGVPGDWITGYMGVAYLETASNNVNGIDDDNDGLIDESRDDGIDNDGDWKSFSDLNENGSWDVGEPLNDDVGMDGVGPENEKYVNPDEGEGDGIPTDGEPNFDRTDISESDMIGLTALSIYKLGDGGTGGGWPKDDEEMWQRMTANNFDVSLQNANVSYLMSSGPFNLSIGDRQRISSSLFFAKNLDELKVKKIIAQEVYENNYLLSEDESFSINYPVSGDTVSGEITVLWSTGNCSDNITNTRIYLSQNEEDYQLIGEDSTNSGSIVFNSEEYDDGIFYKLKIISEDGSLCGQTETEKHFVINNPGNAKPQFQFFNIAKEKWKSNYTLIEFASGDPDGDKSKISLYYGLDTNLLNAKMIFTNKADTTKSFSWNTSLIPNNPEYYLFGKIESEYDTVIVVSKPFRIENKRDLTKGTELTTSSNTRGTGNFYFSKIANQSIKGNDYKIEFVELSDSTDVGYSLYDISNQEYIYENEEIGLDKEGSFFNGIVLSIYNDTSNTIIEDSTKWLVGNCNWSIFVLPDISSPARVMHWEEDFKLTFDDEKVYTTHFFKLPMNFEIKTLSGNELVDYEVFDNDENGNLSIGDDLVILYNLQSYFRTTWQIQFRQPPGIGQPFSPQSGDVYQIMTTKRFKPGDEITFSTSTIVGIEDNNKIINEFELEQNYPNPFNPTTTIKYSIPSLPSNIEQKVTLSVFDILGKKVATLVGEHKKPGNYSVQFNASKLSSGVYYYQLKSGEFLQTKKMLLLK